LRSTSWTIEHSAFENVGTKSLKQDVGDPVPENFEHRTIFRATPVINEATTKKGRGHASINEV
jgi:hypothetical protein